MTTHIRFISFGGTVLMTLLLSWQTASTQEARQAQPLSKGATPPAGTGNTAAAQGYTVLASGPVHEAYAQPDKQNPEPTPVVPKKPPPPIREEPPDQKPQGDNVQWIPGYWG